MSENIGPPIRGKRHVEFNSLDGLAKLLEEKRQKELFRNIELSMADWQNIILNKSKREECPKLVYK